MSGMSLLAHLASLEAALPEAPSEPEPVHAPGECDPDVVRVLSEGTGEHVQAPDPRWDALKELKNKRH